MNINNIEGALKSFGPIDVIKDKKNSTDALGADGFVGSSQNSNQAASQNFLNMLKSSIEDVNTEQNDAEKSVRELAVGQRKNIHETMIALEKAEVSFKMMSQVRNKIIEAYREIMRMNV